MPHRDGIHIEEEELPGVGMRDDFLTEEGRRVGVITRRNGQRELLIYAKRDPDSVSETVRLSEAEADILAEYLGTRKVIQRLSRVTDAVKALNAEKVVVGAGSDVAGRTLEESRVRYRTGASIVAIWRNGEVSASPEPDFLVRAGDTLILIGTTDTLTAARTLISGE